MGKHAHQRSAANDLAAGLLDAARNRVLTPEELRSLRESFSGTGGLVPSWFDSGQFFTPPVVVEFMIALLGITGGDVLEPSCGGGAFIGALPPACRVTGLELQGQAAAVARLLNPAATIIQGDALQQLEAMAGRFDYCIGNPPFIDLPRGAAYAGFDWANGQRDGVWYFLEIGMRALRPGGWLAFVVPDGILANRSCLDRRTHLLDHYWLRAVISLPRETFLHAGTGVKTSVLVVQKPDCDFRKEDMDYSVFMAVAEQMGWDSRRRPTGKCDLPEILTEWRRLALEVVLTNQASAVGQPVLFYKPAYGEPAQASHRRLA